MSVPGYGEIVFKSDDMPSFVTPSATVSLMLTGTKVGQLRPGQSADPVPQAAATSFLPDGDPARELIRQSPGMRSYRNAVAAPKAPPSTGLYAAHAAQAADRLAKVIGRASTDDRLVKGRYEALLPRSGSGMAAALTNMLVALSSGGVAAWLCLDVPGADLVVRPVAVDLPGMGAWQAAPFPFVTQPPLSWGWLAWREEAGVRKIIIDVPTASGTRFQARAASVDSRLDILVCLPPRSEPGAAPVTFGNAHRIARELGIETSIKVSVDPSMIVDLSRACRIDMAM
jgi:hypothetical protein